MNLPTVHNRVINHIAKQLHGGLNLYFTDCCNRCGGHTTQHILFKEWDEVRTEYHDGNEVLGKAFRYDIALLKKGMVIGVIEVRDTSPVKSEKWFSLTDEKTFPWIEVNADARYFLESDPWIVSESFPKEVTYNYHPLFNYCDDCNEKIKAENAERARYFEYQMAAILKSDEILDTRFIDIYRYDSNYHRRDVVLLQTPRGEDNHKVFYVRLEDGRYLDQAFTHMKDAYEAIEQYFDRLDPEEFFTDDPSDFDQYGNSPTCYYYPPKNASDPNEYPLRYEFNPRIRKWETIPDLMKWEDEPQNWGKRYR